jgi:hypothetical protein
VLATIIEGRDNVRMSSDQEKEWKAMLTRATPPAAGAEATKRVEIIDGKSNAVATILTIIKNIRTKYPNDASNRTVVHPYKYDNVQGGKKAARNIKTQILTLDEALQKLGVVAAPTTGQGGSQRAALSAMAARVSVAPVADAPNAPGHGYGGGGYGLDALDLD